MDTNTNIINETPAINEIPVVETPVIVAPAAPVEVVTDIAPVAQEPAGLSVGEVAMTALAVGAVVYVGKKAYDKLMVPALEKAATGFLRYVDRRNAKKAAKEAVVTAPVTETPVEAVAVEIVPESTPAADAAK